MNTILDVRDVRKRFGSVQALGGVSFQVEAGEIFGLLGPNGAGKTTLMSILSGLLHQDAGAVLINGATLHPNNHELKKLIGIVPQDLAIYGELTARENLCFFGELYGVSGAELNKRVTQILDAIGLSDRADVRAGQFSGGMKRRLNLGAALVHQPKILLLDEPTTGVDPQSRNRIFEEVRRLNAAGMTIIYTSHYMEEVQALCPRVGIIDQGVLIACDHLPALLKQMTGLIRFRVPELSAGFADKLAHLGSARFRVREDGAIELESTDVKKTLLELVALLQSETVALQSLETEEPNLERVFLHLTGRGLRD